MSQGLDYPILLNPPTKVPITYEQFNHLSYMGLSSIFCNYKVLIGKNDENYTIYMNNGTQYSFMNQKRFENLKECWFINSSAELVYCKIPIDHPLINTINRMFSHLIME